MILDSRRREPWSTIIIPSASPIPLLSNSPFSNLAKHGDPLLVVLWNWKLSTFKEHGKAHGRFVRVIISQEEDETRASALRLLENKKKKRNWEEKVEKKRNIRVVNHKRTVGRRFGERGCSSRSEIESLPLNSLVNLLSGLTPFFHFICCWQKTVNT